MKTLLALLLAPALALALGPTPISDTLYEADGSTLFNGNLRITWGTFKSADNQQHPAAYMITNVTNGALSLNLEPNDTATPAGTFYTVNYQLQNGQPIVECWIVPTSTPPVGLSTIRENPALCGTSFPLAGTIGTSQITPGPPNTWLNTNGGGVVQWNPFTLSPAATGQLQYLRIQPNTGNNTTYQWNTLPQVYVADYNFPTQTPGGSLTGGTPATVNLSPCPLGVNGSDTRHFLYVSGGSSGSPEPVLISGGTCTSGNNSGGSVTFTPANTHTGAWTIQSATAGIEEALVAVASGGTAILPVGTSTIYSSIWMNNSNVCLVGQGPASKIFLGNATYSDTLAWTWGVNVTGAIIVNSSLSNNCIKNFTMDMNGSTQNVTGIVTGLGTAIVLTGNNTESVVDSVILRNNPSVSGVAFLGVLLWIGTTHNTVSNNVFYGTVCNYAVSGGLQGIGSSGIRNRMLYNYQINGCAGAVGSGSGLDDLIEGNIWEAGSSTMNPGVQIFYADSSTGTRIVNNSCNGNAACFAAITDSGTTIGTTFADNIARNCGIGYQQGASGGSNVFRTAVYGGTVSSCSTPLQISASGGGTAYDISVKDANGVYGNYPGIISFSATNENVAINDIATILGTASGAFSIGGFTGGFEGRLLTIINGSTQAMTINNNDASSSAGNRICTPTGANVTLAARNSIAFFQFSSVSSNCWWLTNFY